MKTARFVTLLLPVCLLGGSCPPEVPGPGGGVSTTLLNQTWERTCPIAPYACIWEAPNGQGADTYLTATFTPTAVGKTVILTFTGSSASMRIPANVFEGIAIFDDEPAPTSSTTTLSFVTQNTNVHSFIAGSVAPITGAEEGDSITVEIVQKP